jgi:phospholipid/cholesterol/gamma-HCH transport system substrate-binding protein
MMGRQVRVGILVLAALVVFMATILTLGRQEHVWERKQTYELHLVRTNGLQSGGQVSLSGVTVGSVTGLRFPANLADSYIVVTIEVARAVTDRIRGDTVASVRTLGLLGDRYIELTPGSPDQPAIEAGGLIAAIDPVDYEQVLGRSGDIVTNVVEVTTSLKDVLQTIQRGEGLLGAMVQNKEFGDATLQNLESSLQNVRQTSQRLDDILARVDKGEGIAGRLLRDTPDSRKLWARLDHSVTQIDTLSTKLATGNGALIKLVDDEAYGRRVLENLDVTLRELRDVMDKVNSGQGSLGKLVNDASLYDDARGLVRDVRSSWLVAFYRGVSGLWPFGRSVPPEAPTAP